MYGYLFQVLKNNEKESITETDQITAILHSNETNEIGRADCFYQKKKSLARKSKVSIMHSHPKHMTDVNQNPLLPQKNEGTLNKNNRLS